MSKLEENKLTDTIHYEMLSCGHQNNLLLPGNKSGVCPKGYTDITIDEFVYLDEKTKKAVGL